MEERAESSRAYLLRWTIGRRDVCNREEEEIVEMGNLFVCSRVGLLNRCAAV